MGSTIKKRERILLGVNDKEEFVFGEMELKEDPSGEVCFLSCGYTVEPFCGTSFDIMDYWKGVLEGESKEWKYDMCEKYHCSPQYLAAHLSREEDDPRNIVDCSLYPEEIRIKSKPWYFYSQSMGQIDEICGKGPMKEWRDAKMLLDFILLHNQYHLKNVDRVAQMKISNFMDYCDAFREEDERFIREYIEDHEEELKNLPI